MKDWQLINQGAEAKVYETTFCGKECIVKERFAKTYRHPVLDKKLTHRRLIQEARCNMKCRIAGVVTPCIYLMDEDNGCLFMEKLLGMSVKDFLRQETMQQGSEIQYSQQAYKVAYEVGKHIAKMHDADIVHGDLTTSNMMFRSKDNSLNSLTIIDFGLANSQPLLEDKAVDLYVMERAFDSTHVGSKPLVEEILRAYKAVSRCSDQTFQKLSVVRLRGRKRTMVG